MEIAGRRGAGGASFTRLKWLTIIAPLAFLALLQWLLHSVVEGLHDFPWFLLLFVWVASGIAVFSFGIFRIIGALERKVFEHNQELEALLAVGRAATSSLYLSEVLEKALDAILRVTSAEAAEVWLATGDGDLELERHRGLAPEAFLERTRFRRGEGLPGVAAESGAPLLVHDLASDPRFLRQGVTRLGFQSFCALPLRHRGETVGVLAVAARDPEALRAEAELRLLEGIGERLAIAIENSRLHERVLDRAVLEERERIARELHDGLAQVLGYINTQTLAIKKLLASGRSEEAEQQLHAMEDAARQVYGDVREAILGLRTSLASADGLVPSVRRYLESYGEMTRIATRLDVNDQAEALRLPARTEIQIMRIVQEALSNVRKHAQASRVTVCFTATEDGLTVEVADDGQGFVQQPDTPGWPHFGLETMRERTAAIGGRFEVVSRPGLGTRVIVNVPLGPARATVPA